MKKTLKEVAVERLLLLLEDKAPQHIIRDQCAYVRKLIGEDAFIDLMIDLAIKNNR